MTLTTRLTTFFLGALALVLVGFSLTLYLLAQAYLDRQAGERVETALGTLAAAVDISEGLLEWEGHERHLTLGKDAGLDQVRWTVHAADGQLLGKSDNLIAADLIAANTIADRPEQRWRLATRTMRASGPSTATQQPRPGEPPRHTELVLTAAVSLLPQEGTLHMLALALAGLSAAVLALATLAGRRLCRRALAPVTAMAGAARAITPADLDARLPATGTADELADLETAFNDLLGRLQEAFERQRRFTGDASHQLRTPLAALLGQVEVALRRERTPAEYRETLGRVCSQAGHLQQIVEMLLFLTRADAEAALPDMQEIDPADWLGKHIERWSDHPRRPDMQLHVEPCRVRVQPALLGQLLDNLLDNACKYSEPGTPITLRIEPSDNDVILTVADAGAGIAAVDLPHVFTPFFRSAEARRLGKAGVGLGLAVAKRIAAALGGTLEAQSAAGQGSRFVLQMRANP